MNAPIIVTGCRRSGTTLLKAMLAQHPELHVHPDEPQFILEGWDRFGRNIKRAHQAIDYVTGHPYCADNVTTASFENFIGQRSQLPYGEFTSIYINLWSSRVSSKNRPVLKDPAFIYRLDLAHKLFPDAQTIHMIRDPRGNISSQLARWKTARLWECLQRWKTAIEAGQDWARDHSTNYHELSYEALVQAPAPTLRALCEYLKIQFSEAMLQFKLAETLYSPHNSTKAVTFNSVNPARLEIWRNQLSSSEIAVIEAQTTEMAELWVFPPATLETSRSDLRRRILEEQAYYTYLKSGRAVKHFFRSAGWWIKYRV